MDWGVSADATQNTPQLPSLSLWQHGERGRHILLFGVYQISELIFLQMHEKLPNTDPSCPAGVWGGCGEFTRQEMLASIVCPASLRLVPELSLAHGGEASGG